MKRKYVQAMMTGMTAMLAVTVPVTTVAAATPEKEQTVYVNADQNGNVEKVIVSNWLKNTDKESTLEDNSELNDITNVKGEESYTQGSNGKLVWAEDGNDIYYQGETSGIGKNDILSGRQGNQCCRSGRKERKSKDPYRLYQQFFPEREDQRKERDNLHTFYDGNRNDPSD